MIKNTKPTFIIVLFACDSFLFTFHQHHVDMLRQILIND